MDVDGLPVDGALSAQGSATIAFGGECFYQPPTPVSFAYRYSRDAAALPYAMTLEVDWLHPQTQKPALTLAYQADMEQLPASTMVERVYDNQNDFFHLNESFMEEYKQLYSAPRWPCRPFLFWWKCPRASSAISWASCTKPASWLSWASNDGGTHVQDKPLEKRARARSTSS